VQFLVLFFVVLFATATGVVMLVARDLTQPAKQLERRADAMGHGDLRSAVPIGPEPDEMGRLAVAFEEMRRALDDKIAALQELHQSLEQKVADRTADLERSNVELRQTLEALRVAQAKLIASEKMAVVGQLTAGVAHEINNPVNAVVNTVEPLERLVGSLSQADGRAAAEARAELGEMLRVIKSGAERTKRIVQALRNYARGDRDEAVDYEIHRGLDEALELLRHELRGNIRVNRQYGDVGSLRCHAGQLNQVFVNLITNAAQALHGRDDGRIEVRTRSGNGEVEIQIADNGPGIPPELLPRIFDPFFTTKPVGEGTGLGLSISQQIVERHGGSLRVESPPGAGATFTITLPRG
jgi:C4-dicarboxylate-specific signal transduction histidine kinase